MRANLFSVLLPLLFLCCGLLLSSCSGESCKKTNGGIETCDGIDNDCDGRVDEDPESLCSLPHASSVCEEGFCRILACEDGFSDADGRLITGCEIPTMCIADEPLQRRDAAPWNTCPAPGELAQALTVTAMEREDQYFGAEDRRTVDATALLPEESCWQQIFMEIQLECPASGRCDAWDRTASVALVTDAQDPDGGLMELARYITPYGVGMCTLVDVTAFASLLRGEVRLRSFVDTWVGPGNPYGDGWRVSVRFHFIAGTPVLGVPRVINLLARRNVELGNPENPIPAQLPPFYLETAAGDPENGAPRPPRLVRLRLLATGHGQGNALNCGEFCRIAPTASVNGSTHVMDNWRYDCAANPVNGQQGTWTYSRQGWCPGALVTALDTDITADLTTGSATEILLDFPLSSSETYVNSCRPGAGIEQDGVEICENCTYGSNACAYDGGAHTAPLELVSAQVFLYD